MATLIQRLFARRNRKVGVVHRRVSLDRVGQGINAAIGGHFGRTGNRQEWIDDSHSRPEIVAQNSHFDLVVRVGEHGGGGDF